MHRMQGIFLHSGYLVKRGLLKSINLRPDLFFYLIIARVKLRHREMSYPKIALRSASGVLIGVKPNLSTNTFSTFDEKKAGMEGPM